MRIRLRLFLLATAIALVAAIGLFTYSIVKTRLVVNVDHPNGSRLRVVQKLGYESFYTAIYFDDGDGQWRWYYYDHNDAYWGSASILIDDNVIKITSDQRRIEMDTKTGDCTISDARENSTIMRKSTKIVSLPEGVRGAD